MKLYIAHGSPNCRKVQAVVHHLGVEPHLEVLDPSRAEHKTADYLALNPNGRVPALLDGDLRLWESHAIMQYLCHRHGDTSLFPPDPARQADIARWQCWELAHFGNHLGTALFERVFKPFAGTGEVDEQLVSRALESFWPFARILDEQVRDRPFVCGDDVTLADFSLAAQLDLCAYGRVDLQPYPDLRAWWRRLEEIDAWRETAMPAPMRALLDERVGRS